jgi:hypothetical protein
MHTCNECGKPAVFHVPDDPGDGEYPGDPESFWCEEHGNRIDARRMETFSIEKRDGLAGFGFRIVKRFSDGGMIVGRWSAYDSIATLTHEGKTYIAVTDFFKGKIPHEKVLEIIEV